MTRKPLRILVISDIHAHAADPRSGPSHYSTSPTWEDPGVNPLNGICNLMAKEGLEADLIVCPGDISDRAEPVAQKAAWAKLNEIKARLGASHLVGSAGNHDLDSRRLIADIDPKGALLCLDPPFPISAPLPDALRSADSYWARNFVRTDLEAWDATLLNLNSSAFHGYASEAGKPPEEHNHGRISRLTLEGIAGSLALSTSKINVMLTHHHLKRNPYVDDQNSAMIGGDLLIEALKDSGRQWLVIHGHLHVPMLSYADADPFTPIILSAASVAARTYQVRGKHPRNQIHHVAIDPADNASGQRLLGTVTSFTWSFQVGWQKSSAEELVSYLSGFGYRPDPTEAADALIAEVKAAGGQVVRWEKVVERLPNFRFMMRKDMEGMLHLSKQKGLKIDEGKHGLPSTLELP